MSQLPPATPEPAAAGEAPTHIRAPLCFVVDGDRALRRFVSLILQGSGIDTMEFAEGAALRNAKFARSPDLIFLDINLDVQDAMETLETLGSTGFTGAVQLMSNRGSAVLESVKAKGEQHNVKMLPVLKKPFETSAIQKIAFEQKLGNLPAAAARIDLDEALKNQWIEFWIQPKIDLRRKQLAGAECYARLRHPQHGVLMPDSFLPGASDASVLALSELAVVGALKVGVTLSNLGVNLPIAVNVPLPALVKLPVGDIVRSHRPDPGDWPGLVIDIVEQQVIGELGLASELSAKLSEHRVKLAIDDFGRGYAALSKARDLPFAEFKLDRAFVVDCGTNKVNAPICKTVIELAHGFGSVAVGMGIEKAADSLALVSMGCDLGQGFLLGQPMPQERFVALLRQRATVRAAPPAPAPTARDAEPTVAEA